MDKTIQLVGVLVGVLGGVGALLASVYSMLGIDDDPTTAVVVTGVVMAAAALLFGFARKIYKKRQWNAYIRKTFVLSDAPYYTKPNGWRVYRCFYAVFLVYLGIMYLVSIAAALDGNQTTFRVALMLWILPSAGYMYVLMGLSGREEFRRLRFWWRRRKVKMGTMWVK